MSICCAAAIGSPFKETTLDILPQSVPKLLTPSHHEHVVGLSLPPSSCSLHLVLVIACLLHRHDTVC